MNEYLKQCIAQNMPVIFDYDGVLFEARWYEDRINMRGETEEMLIAAQNRGENLYTAPIPAMIKFVSSLNNEIYVLSHMHSNAELKAKQDQIRKYYPGIPVGNILKANSIEDKIPYMERIQKKHGPFIYIDDNHHALIKYENTFPDECKFFHVSSLYV